MKKLSLALTLVAAFASVCSFGCGGVKKPADLPELFPCKISIVQDGKPLEGASVSLYDPSGASRFVMGSVTDANGVAELKTDAKYPGVPAGKYKVLVSKTFVPDTSSLGVPPEDPDAKAEYDAKLAELSSQQADLVDLQYKRPNTTPEEIEVAAGGAVEKTIDVGEAIHEEVDMNH